MYAMYDINLTHCCGEVSAPQLELRSDLSTGESVTTVPCNLQGKN